MAKVICRLVVRKSLRRLRDIEAEKSRSDRMQSSSIARSANATSSASQDDMLMQCCRRGACEMTPPASMITYPVVDLVVAQLLSA